MDCEMKEEEEKYQPSFIQLWNTKNIDSSNHWYIRPIVFEKKTLNGIKKNISECIACSKEILFNFQNETIPNIDLFSTYQINGPSKIEN
ncbi:uncharacterized protein LOC144294288 isoform X2 [Canis aureus]